MKTYGSFLVRCWLLGDPAGGTRAVFSVEHIQTGRSTRVESLAEAQCWMFEACRPKPAEPPREDAEGRAAAG